MTDHKSLLSATMAIKSECIGALTGLLDCFPAAAVLIGADYRVLGTNRLYDQRYGEVGEGRRCYEISHHYPRPCHEMGEECPMQAAVAKGEAHRVLHLHHSPSGEEHVDVELSPVKNSEGEIIAFVETVRPIKSERDEEGHHRLIGRSAAFNHTMKLIGRVAPSEAAVLLLGESGTGKELAAHAVHRASSHAAGPFVPVDCSGLTESLFESELFGHEKGAFTGAHSRKQGLVEAARGGTLFLDEVGDIPLNLQVKLLRLLETGTFRRVGSTEAQQAEFRLVCATHRDLSTMVEAGEFRRDLYYRISAFPIVMPALRERLEDLPLLVKALLQRLQPARELIVDDQAMACLQRYGYPGNIRELRNILERAVLLADSELIGCEQLPGICDDTHDSLAPSAPMAFNQLLPLPELENQYLRWSLKHHGDNKRALAKALGISERTLYRKLERALDASK